MNKLFKLFTSTLLILLISTISSCSSKPNLPHFDLDENVDYVTFKEYELDNIKNMYDQEEDTYYVYLYRLDCPTCIGVKNSILGYLDLYSKSEVDTKLYLYNTVNLRNDYPSFNTGPTFKDVEEAKEYMLSNSINKIEDTIIKVVPSLYVINNNYLSDYYYGYDVISYIFNL